MSNIKKTNQGYTAQLSVGSGATRIRKSKTFSTKKEATQWLVEQTLFYDRNKAQIYLDKIDAASYYELWVKNHKKNLAENTQDSYWATYRRLRGQLRNFKLTMLTHTQLEALFDQLDDRYSKETLRKDLGHIKSMLREAMRTGLVRSTVNPADGVVVRGNDSLTRKSIDDKVIPLSEFAEIREYLSLYELTTNNHSRNMLALAIISCTAMRGGEALALRPCDIDLDNQKLMVSGSWSHNQRVDPKTVNSYREIPLEEWLIEKLDIWLRLRGKNWRDGQPLLARPDGTVGSVASLTSAFKQLQIKLGYATEYSVHAFRHTIASMMINRGANIVAVSRFLGHGSVRITQDYYLGLVAEDKVDERRQLLGLLA